MFEASVARCMEEALVGGQGFVVDASLIVANVQKQYSSAPENRQAREIDPDQAPRAIREYLDTLDHEAFGAASQVMPRFTAHADPASQCLSAECFAFACRVTDGEFEE